MPDSLTTALTEQQDLTVELAESITVSLDEPLGLTDDNGKVIIE